jgi:tetratricopeptide (TPR) repeat protein
MSAPSPCPGTESLRQFLLGKLISHEAGSVEQHLADCASCLAQVPNLEAEDSVVAAMRAPTRAYSVEQNVVEDLLERVRRLRASSAGPPTIAAASLKTFTDPDQTCGDIPVVDVGAEDPSPHLTHSLPAGHASTRAHPAVPEAPAGPPAPPTVPGYEILGELGRGGMGVVYKARKLNLDRLVALKMILVGAHAGPQELARFRAEAEVVARLHHPGIVQIYEIGEHEGLPYLALEYVEGNSLAKQLDGTPQNTRSAAELVQSLARAMRAAHECGVIHRDLKPANVLLAADGTAKITDFGLAKQLDKEGGQTQSGAIVGTPAYMAPEQAQARHQEIGPAADLYALGVILYELLTGRPPFRSEKPLDTLWQVIHQEPVAPSRLQPSVPRDLETICLKCLQKEPGRRYQSAAALAEDLGRFLTGEPIHARPIGIWERSVKWARRRPTAAALVAVSMLAVSATLMGSVVYAAYTQQRLSEHLRLQTVGNDVQKALARGETARAIGEWQNAQIAFSNALALIGAEAKLAPYQEETERWLAEANRHLEEKRARATLRARQEEFSRLHDQALFHASDLSGLDLPGHREATRRVAGQALELLAAKPPNDAEILDLGPPGSFDDAERTSTTSSCYALFLILAEAVAQPLSSEDRRVQAEQALRILDQAAQLRAPTRAYHLRRASYLAQRGDQPGAQQERARALIRQPDDAVDFFLLGHEAYQNKALAQAVVHMRDTLQRQPEHFWARLLLGVSYLGLHEYDQAETHLTLCQSRQPRLVWIYILRGFASGQRGARAWAIGRRAEAAEHLATAEADFRKAQELLAQDPSEEASYVLAINRGTARFQQEQFAEAIENFQTARGIQPALLPAYMNLAKAYQEQRKWDDAAEVLERAIQLQPNQAVLYHSRAELARARKDLPAALRDFDEAIRLFGQGTLTPRDSELVAADYTYKGELLYLEQRPTQALEALDTALKYRAFVPLVQRLRGAVLLELKSYPDAVEAFDAHLRATKTPTADIYEARGLARAYLKDYAGAIADYSRALDLGSESSALYAYRGWTYLIGEAPGLALRDFENALELDPNNGDAFAGRGSALAKLGSYRLAEKYAREALTHGPETSELVYKVARVYAQVAGGVEAGKRGQYQDFARQQFQKALTLEPDEKKRATLRGSIQTDPAWNAIRRSTGSAPPPAAYSR